jgi:hypothetical protein
VASPVIAQHRPANPAAAATSISKTWSGDTVAGDRLLAILTFEANGVSNISVTPADTTWKIKTPPGRIVRQAAGVDELVVIVYEMINAPARLAANAEVFNLSSSCFATLELMRITGADLVQSNELTPTTAIGSGLSIPLTNPGTPTHDCLALVIAANGNPASTQSIGGSWALVDDLTPGSTGSDRERTDVYSLAVAAGVAVGGATVTISGATNRNYAGVIITIPAPVGSPPDVNVVQSAQLVPSAPGTSFNIPWDFPTTIGNRLFLVVGENENGITTLPTVPGGWGTPVNPPGAVIRLAVGVNTVSARVYEILNAASRSGNENITFDHSIYPYLALLEVAGSSLTVPIDQQSSSPGAGQIADTGATPTTTINDGMALAVVMAANVNNLSPESQDSYATAESGNSTGAANGAKISGGVFTKPISTAGAQQLRVDISGGITRNWVALVLAIPAASQGGGAGGGSPFFANLDDGRMHRALSAHYGSPITSLTLAQQTAAKFEICCATYDATGGQFNDFLDDILAIQPGFKAGFYGKSAQYSGSASTFPHGYYAYTSGGATISTFNGSILVMQPDGTGSYSDPRGFTSTTWKDWISRDAKANMDHENARSPAGNKITFIYGDSMGTSSYKGTQVSPTDGHTYTSAQWIALVRSIGDAMMARVGSSVMVVGNGLTSGPNYFHASTPTAGLLDHVDMGLCENWIRNNFDPVTTFFTETQWQDAVNMMIDITVNRGKAGWCVINIANYTAGNEPTGWTTPTSGQIDQWIRYSTCTWFLGQRGSCVYEFVADSRVPAQGTDHAYWNQRLGAPLESLANAGAMQSAAGKAYHRLFTAGLVLVNPTGSSLTYTADRDYKDVVTGATAGLTTGSTITVPAHTGLMLLTTGSTSGTPNQSAPTVTWDQPSPSLFSDTGTKTVQVTITDADGVATPGHLFQDGVDKGAMTEVGSGTTTRVFQKTGVVFPDGTATTLSVTVADNHASPLTTVSTHQFEYISTPTPPIETPPPPPPPPTIDPFSTGQTFANYVYDEIAPLDFT